MKQAGNRLAGLLPVLVFALFALCLMGVLLTGTGVYRRISQSGIQADQRRTAALYLTTRVHQAEDVRIEAFEGVMALVFPQELEGETYLTRVYCRDGWLWELFCSAQAQLTPEDGEPLVRLEQLDMVLENGILQLDTGDHQLVLILPSGRRDPA